MIIAGVGDPAEELSWAIDKWTVDVNVNGFVEIATWSINFFARQGDAGLPSFLRWRRKGKIAIRPLTTLQSLFKVFIVRV